MIALVLMLIAVGLSISVVLTAAMIGLGHRLGALDSGGVPGQHKAERRRVPNTGGVAIVWAIVLPIGAGLLLAGGLEAGKLPAWASAAGEHLAGLRSESGDGWILLAGMLVLHVLGLVDDRRALGPVLKLTVMLAVTAGVVLATGSRMLTLLDGPAGGIWLSTIVTVLWIVIVTNALNFLDNMDGLSGGVAAIASACFLAATLIQGQWFIGGMLALLLGALLGFLLFNFPWRARGVDASGAPRGGAKIFMGDGGSIVVGFLLGFLTVRTTYVGPELGGGWYGLLMPMVVLAVPLYDLVAVSVIRLRAGRSPMLGDLNHLSHRLVRRGLSPRGAVLVIYVLTAVTALPGIGLGSLKPWQAALVGVQVVLTLALIALIEAKAEFGRTVHWPEGRRP